MTGDEVRTEWGVRREDGTVAGPMWHGEALDILVAVPGGVLVSREVRPGPWEARP